MEEDKKYTDEILKKSLFKSKKREDYIVSYIYDFGKVFISYDFCIN